MDRLVWLHSGIWRYLPLAEAEHTRLRRAEVSSSRSTSNTVSLLRSCVVTGRFLTHPVAPTRLPCAAYHLSVADISHKGGCLLWDMQGLGYSKSADKCCMTCKGELLAVKLHQLSAAQQVKTVRDHLC